MNLNETLAAALRPFLSPAAAAELAAAISRPSAGGFMATMAGHAAINTADGLRADPEARILALARASAFYHAAAEIAAAAGKAELAADYRAAAGLRYQSAARAMREMESAMLAAQARAAGLERIVAQALVTMEAPHYGDSDTFRDHAADAAEILRKGLPVPKP
jgi:hypothetical protein